MKDLKIEDLKVGDCIKSKKLIWKLEILTLLGEKIAVLCEAQDNATFFISKKHN